MGFVKKCFEEEPGIFTESLQGIGFSVEQASLFIPDVASFIIESMQKNRRISNNHLSIVWSPGTSVKNNRCRSHCEIVSYQC